MTAAAPSQPSTATDGFARRGSPEAVCGRLFLLPYVAVFLLFVAYPVGYGAWLGMAPKAYLRLWDDPVYWQAVRNTVLFLLIGANLKMLLALALSAFFVLPWWWVRVMAALFILPWALPHIPAILSIKWMLNGDWGWVNLMLFQLFDIDGPAWLTDTRFAFGAVIGVHVWKNLPFWTMVLVAGRLAISRDLYEAAALDGASRWQRFRFITFPQLRALFVTATLLTTIWSLGDFNSVYLLTGGGPFERTHTLATLGIRYAFHEGSIPAGIATVATALPLLLPILYLLMRRLGR